MGNSRNIGRLTLVAFAFVGAVSSGCVSDLPDANEFSEVASEGADLVASGVVTLDAPVLMDPASMEPSEPVTRPDYRLVQPEDRTIAEFPGGADLMFDELNSERARQGLGPLQRHWDLDDDALSNAIEMVEIQTVNVRDMHRAVPAIWDSMAAQAAVGPTMREVHLAWMTSDAHRDQVLGDYTHVGIGVAQDTRLYVTVVFMKSPIEQLDQTFGPFSDDDFNPHERSIQALYEAGVAHGCVLGDETQFCPQAEFERGQMAAFIVEAFGLPPAEIDYFTDDDGTWYEPYANSFAAAGLTTGCNQDGTSFCGDAQVSRGQLALFLDRAMELPEATGDHYVDDEGSQYEAAANRLVGIGHNLGCDNDRFCPDDKLTRDQAATFMAAVLGLI